MSKVPFILDTDPGIDDAMAIMLLGSCEDLDIRAITVVAGNVGLEHTSNNAKNLAKICQIDTRIALGADKPMIVPQEKAESVHGINGLKGIVLEESDQAFDEKMAWDVIYEEAVKAEGKLHLCAIGPLTNVALAILKYPDLPDLIDKMTVMAGAQTWGNHSEYGEFNVWGDPHAADIVFKSGMKIAMIDLDIINLHTTLTDDDLRDLKATPTVVSSFSDQLYDVYINNEHHKDENGMGIHGVCDCVAAAYVCDPTIFEGKEYFVRIETQGKETFGQTIVDWKGKWGKEPNTIVFSGSDKKRYKELLMKMTDYYAAKLNA